jgi:hypothetical protein
MTAEARRLRALHFFATAFDGSHVVTLATERGQVAGGLGQACNSTQTVCVVHNAEHGLDKVVAINAAGLSRESVLAMYLGATGPGR